MGLKLLSLLKNAKVIALDTAPFIYFIEENPTYINIVEPLFQEISRGNLRAVTSYITLIEVLIKPLEEKNDDLIKKIQRDSERLRQSVFVRRRQRDCDGGRPTKSYLQAENTGCDSVGHRADKWR